MPCGTNLWSRWPRVPIGICSYAICDMTHDNEILSIASAFVLLVLLASAVATDLRNHRIPNVLLVSALNLALILHTIGGGVEGLITAVGGLVIGLAMLLPIYAVGGMGAGDVKLLGVVGCFLGPWGAAIAGLATMMVGAVLGIAIIVWKRVWPVLELQVTQLLISPETELRTTSVSHPLGRGKRVIEIPYAPAIAVGTVAALRYIDYLPERFLG